jgi:hypothetical protein
VENHYKISLSNHSVASESVPQRQLVYKLDKSYLSPNSDNSHKDSRNTFYENYRNTLQDAEDNDSPTSPHFEAINNFLSLKIEGYLVLLI